MVDGAHAVNQVDVDLMDLDCAAYFSNFHKWSYAPKNTAFLYISNEYINVRNFTKLAYSTCSNWKFPGIRNR